MSAHQTMEPGFLGKGWAFPPSFDLSEQTAVMVAAEHDIRESLYILLTTIPGERVMLPGYGCPVHEHVFDLASETLFTHMQTMIGDAILYYEPRIIVENINIAMPNPLDGRLLIEIDYLVIQTNTRNNLVIPYCRNEATLAPVLNAA